MEREGWKPTARAMGYVMSSALRAESLSPAQHGFSGEGIQANSRAAAFHPLSLNSPTQSGDFWFPLSSRIQSNRSTRCVRAV